eukprot:GSChrysophyteH2.ASY1.ANO1.886.1 assembled CDS
MEAPRMGNGADFDHSAPYRMYHGERVPGFPSHPHRGFETLTATIEGLVDHADSTGCAGRYGQGDNQWMTAGKGIQHSEMFPLINQTSPNPLRFFQIWLNLPGAKKMVDPFFVMHWAEEVPKFVSSDGLTSGTIFAGELEGKKGLAPPPNSWAATKENEVAVWHITLKPGAQFTLPVAKGGQDINRQAYFIEGKALTMGDRAMNEHVIVNLNAGITAELHNHGSDTSEVLVLQGKPIGQPVVQHGPFVMNTDAEIRQAFSDYQQTQSEVRWPWSDSGHVFPQDKGRFALQDGVETNPPLSQCAPASMSIKELKSAITRAGLQEQTKGLSEKHEFIELLAANQQKK